MDLYRTKKIIAVDIVIIPEKQLFYKAIQISTQLNSPKIKLNVTDQIPHISLLQGGLEVKKLNKFSDKLKFIVSEFKPFKILINEVITKQNDTSLRLEKSLEILNLQNRIVDELLPLLKYDNTLDSIADSTTGKDQKTLYWINLYPKKSTGKNFSPHITLGNAKLKDISNIKLPIMSIAKKIGLYHLGNYCTCNKLIKKYLLLD